MCARIRDAGFAVHNVDAVSAVNRPSKYDHGVHGVEVDHARTHCPQSRSSTNRASTITPRRIRPVHRVLVSAVNQPSKYDHRLGCRWAASTSSLGRQPTEQVRSLFYAILDHPVSAVNQPSKYDHNAVNESESAIQCLGRQPTEQVRSHFPRSARWSVGGAGSLGRQPTEQVRSHVIAGGNKDLFL